MPTQLASLDLLKSDDIAGSIVGTRVKLRAERNWASQMPARMPRREGKEISRGPAGWRDDEQKSDSLRGVLLDRELGSRRRGSRSEDKTVISKAARLGYYLD